MIDTVIGYGADVERDAQRRRAAHDGRDPEHGWAWGRTPGLAAPRRPWAVGRLRTWRPWRLATTSVVATAPQ